MASLIAQLERERVDAVFLFALNEELASLIGHSSLAPYVFLSGLGSEASGSPILRKKGERSDQGNGLRLGAAISWSAPLAKAPTNVQASLPRLPPSSQGMSKPLRRSRATGATL